MNVMMVFKYMTDMIFLIKMYELLQWYGLQGVRLYCFVENNEELHNVLGRITSCMIWL